MIHFKVNGCVYHAMPLMKFWEEVIPEIEGGICMVPGFKVRMGGRVSAELDLDEFVSKASPSIGKKLAKLLGGPVREFLFSSEGGRVHYDF